MLKDTVKKVKKKQHTEGEKIFADHVSDKDSRRIDKELIQRNNSNNNDTNQLKNG